MRNISGDRLKAELKLSGAMIIGMLLLIVSTTITYLAPQAISVEIGPAHSRQVEAGQVIVYDHVLTNTGTLTDTFFLEVSSKRNWPVALMEESYPNGTAFLPVVVSPQMTLSFQVSLTVPARVGGVTEITTITVTSQLSPTVWDATTDTSRVSGYLYLPLVVRYWPPVPYAPSLNTVQETAYGQYTVAWGETPIHLAITYTLEEATDAAFTANLREACTTTQQSCAITGRLVGTYYYRVRGQNDWGFGGWSNVQTAQVLWADTPTSITENFSNPASGWHNGETVFGSARYVNGEYRLIDTDDIGGTTRFEAVSPEWIAPNDLEMKVEARIDQWTTGIVGHTPSMSLIFGLKTIPWGGELLWIEWYEFRISPETRFYELTEWSNLGSRNEDIAAGTSNAILSDPKMTQTLEVHRSGNTITLMINGTQLTTTVDNNNPFSGRRSVGLGGGSFRVATYDNFEVRSSGLITTPLGTR